MSARLLDPSQARSVARIALPRGPIVVAVAIAALLLVCVLFVGTAIERAAHMAVRGQVESVRDASRRLDGRDEAALRRFVDAHAEMGLRYAALLESDGRLGASAGDALGTAIVAGTPSRVGNRVRVVLADERMLVELETIAANDIVMAGRIAFLVVVAVDALTIALGILFARSLRTREELAQRLEAERRLAALGEMSAVLAHELKNPLTSLKGNAQLLAETLPSDKKMERVVREAVRLERLTNDLLDFVKTGTLTQRRADLRAVVASAIESVDSTRIDPLPSATVDPCEIDPERLRVALENILRNAVQASDAGRVEVSIEQAKSDVAIVVRDHGPGLPEADKGAIFEPFRTGKAKGTGLGLAIAKRIVELHGGTIEASNHSSGGAVFRMTIPRGPRSA